MKWRLKSSLLTFLLFSLVLLLVPFNLDVENVGAQNPPSPYPSPVAALEGFPIIFEETNDYVRLNNTAFIIEFYKGSDGYNKICHRNGSVLVHNDRIVLEYWTGKQWKQRGTPTSVSWIKVNDYWYNVTRHYTDYLGTEYDVTYVVKSNSPIKIAITLKSGQTDTYRIAWTPSGITYTKWRHDSEGRILIFGNKTFKINCIGFDWNDVYQSFGNITEISVEEVANGKKANIYFNIGEVQAGQTIVVDPSIVASPTSTSWTTCHQRKTFRANGYFWVFYYDISDHTVKYKSSSDGITWSSAMIAGDGIYAWYDFDTFLEDETTIHLAYCDSSGDLPFTLYYKRGTLGSGTISWGSAYVVATGDTDTPSVIADTNGYPWVAYRNGTGVSVRKATAADGSSWEPPFQLFSSGEYDNSVILNRLPGGKVYAIYRKGDSFSLFGRLYDGSSWGSEVVAISGYDVRSREFHYSSVVDGNGDIHLVTRDTSVSKIGYAHYDSATDSWSSASDIITTGSPYMGGLTINNTSQEIYLWYYDDSNIVYYKKYNIATETWEEATAVWDRSSSPIATGTRWCVYESTSGPYAGGFWIEGASAPYNVVHGDIGVTYAAPPNAPTLDSPAADTRFDPGESVTFSWTFNDPDAGDSQSAFQFQLDDNSDFSSPIIDTGKVSSSSTSTTQTLPSTVGLYYWRVKTWDSNDLEGSWSSGRTIIVDRIKVNSITASDTRVNVGASVTLTVNLVYEYDSTAITSGSFTLNGLTLTHQGSGSWTTSDSRSSVTAVTYNSVSGSVGNLNTVNMNGQSITVIWDRIHSTAISASDTRVNVGDSVNIDVTLKYDYDETAVTTGAVTINGISATHQGSGVWRITVSQSSVTAVTYGDSISVSGDTYGITATSADAGTVTVIWDKISVSLSANDYRVNIDDTVTISWTITRQYDSSSITDFSIAISKDGGAWYSGTATSTTDSDSAVAKHTYTCTSITDNTYGLTAFDTNSIDVIWDRLVVTLSVDDGRVNVGDSVTVSWSVIYDYDDSAESSFTINVYRDGVSWFSGSAGSTTDSETAVTKHTYTVNSITGNTYGIVAFTANSVDVIWDKLTVTLSVDDSRCNVGETRTISWTITRQYDSSTVSDFSITIYRDGSLFYSGADTSTTDSESSVTSHSYTTNAITDNAYGITAFDANTVNIIWDRVQVTLSVSDLRIDVGTSMAWTYSAIYEYDGTDATSYVSVTLNDSETAKNSVGKWAFTVASLTESQYGLTAFTSNTIECIWDKVVFTLTVADNRIDVGSSASISVQGVYAYDDVAFVGSYSLNDTLTKTAVGKYGYKVSSMADSLYGLTVFETNEVYVIFDKVQLTISTSDDRIDVGSPGSVSVSGVYAYDGEAWSGTYTLNDTLTKNAVGKYGYTVSSITDDNYGLTVFECNSISIIFDRVQITLTVEDNRINVGSTGSYSFTATYEYDGADATSFVSVTLNDTLTKSSVGKYGYTVSSITESQYDLTAFTSNAFYIIFDKVVIDTFTVSDNRINVGDTASFTVSGYYAYDSGVWSGSYTLNDTATKNTVGKYGYSIASITDDNYGLTVFEQTVPDVYVIFDKLTVTLSTPDDRIDVGSTATINYEVTRQYDGSASSATVTLNDTLTKNVVGKYGYTVSSVSGDEYGITAFDANSISIIFDRVQITLSVDDDRIDVGSSGSYTYVATYEYDGSDASSFVTLTLNDTLTKDAVGRYGYTVSSITEAQYGLTTFTSNSFYIIFDRVQITLSVSDSRIDVGSTMSWSYAASYEYDGSDASSFVTVTLNDTATKNSVGKWAFTTSSITETQYGLTAFTSNTIECIWDKLNVVFSASDLNPLVGETVTISWTITRLYDGRSVTNFVIDVARNGTLWISGTSASSATDSSDVAVTYVYDVHTSSVTDVDEGLTTFQSTPVIVTWSEAPNVAPEIISISVSPSRTDIYYNITLTIRDADSLNDLSEINITVWEPSETTYGSSDNPANHFTFKWTPESGWSEVSLSGYLVDSVEPSDLSVTEGIWSIKAMFDTSESIIGNYTIRVFVSDQMSSTSTDTYVIHDKLNVVFSASDLDPLVDTSVTIGWTITRLFDNSVVADFVIDISKDGVLWKSGLTGSSVKDVSGVGSHTYDVYSVTDNAYGLTLFQSTPVTITWHAQSVSGSTEYTGPAPPQPSIYLDIIVKPILIDWMWWEATYTVHATAINKGTLGADFKFEYRILDKAGNVVYRSVQTVYIDGLEEKTLNITIPELPNGEYTFHVRCTSPIKAEGEASLTVKRPTFISPVPLEETADVIRQIIEVFQKFLISWFIPIVILVVIYYIIARWSR